MREHKLIQLNYHSVVEKHSDDLADLQYIVESLNSDSTLEYIKKYFTIPLNEITYPGKSFCVAIIYSFLIQKYFNVIFWESLRDPNLFLGNDLFFQVYGSSEIVDSIYDCAIDFLIQNELIDFESSNIPQVVSTVSYFKSEFNLSF